MPDNLALYNIFRSVPAEAKKEIKGGRLNGKTDINPMWRIKALTEQFGPCGVGWWYEIKDKHLERAESGETAAFVDINLYYVHNGTQSMPVPGTGGSSFIAREKNGLYVSDECYKMALTDAISVACKAIGIGADVYWEKGRTKYTNGEGGQSKAQRKAPEQKPNPQNKEKEPETQRQKRRREYLALGKKYGITASQLKTVYETLVGKGHLGETSLMRMEDREYEESIMVIESRLQEIGYKAAS